MGTKSWLDNLWALMFSTLLIAVSSGLFDLVYTVASRFSNVLDEIISDLGSHLTGQLSNMISLWRPSLPSVVDCQFGDDLLG